MYSQSWHILARGWRARLGILWNRSKVGYELIAGTSQLQVVVDQVDRLTVHPCQAAD